MQCVWDLHACSQLWRQDAYPWSPILPSPCPRLPQGSSSPCCMNTAHKDPQCWQAHGVKQGVTLTNTWGDTKCNESLCGARDGVLHPLWEENKVSKVYVCTAWVATTMRHGKRSWWMRGGPCWEGGGWGRSMVKTTTHESIRLLLVDDLTTSNDYKVYLNYCSADARTHKPTIKEKVA